MTLFRNFILLIILPLFLLPCALGEGVAVRGAEKASVVKSKKNTKNEIERLLDTLSSEATGEDNNEHEQSSGSFKAMKRAKIVVLNKITAKSEQIIFDIGQVKFFGNLSIEVHKCVQSTDLYEPNNLMLLTIFDNKVDDDQLSVFHGWIATSNPSLSTLEHPVYEVIPMSCLPLEVKKPANKK
jgi:hypothetical protein